MAFDDIRIVISQYSRQDVQLHYLTAVVTSGIPGFDSRHYQKKKVVSLERGSLSLVSTTEELLDRQVAAPV
jgi:hypothetical protein